jgi:hypothetical protein
MLNEFTEKNLRGRPTMGSTSVKHHCRRRKTSRISAQLFVWHVVACGAGVDVGAVLIVVILKFLIA